MGIEKHNEKCQSRSHVSHYRLKSGASPIWNTTDTRSNTAFNHNTQSSYSFSFSALWYL